MTSTRELLVELESPGAILNDIAMSLHPAGMDGRVWAAGPGSADHYLMNMVYQNRPHTIIIPESWLEAAGVSKEPWLMREIACWWLQHRIAAYHIPLRALVDFDRCTIPQAIDAAVVALAQDWAEGGRERPKSWERCFGVDLRHARIIE